ncbi:MAG: cation:proton antiporter [Deltaproteobacteria bacterium]|nr:cation:proton antiporter [Deltaproteobacteria bacterium]
MHAGNTLGTRSGLLVVGVGFVLIAAWFVGRLASTIGLPKLTGYLGTGIVAGPTLLGYLGDDTVRDLGLVNGMAVSLIMLTAGSEMDFRAMRPLLRSIAWISLIGVLGTALLLGLATFVLRSTLPFLADLSSTEAFVVSLVLGIVLVPQSPAVVVALRSETGADGPVARTALGTVVLANVLLIPIFAVASAIAQGVMAGQLDPADTARQLAWEILGSIAIGLGVGAILAAWLRFVGTRGLDLFVLGACFVSAEVGRRLRLDPQLIMLAAGMVVENAAREGGTLRRAYEAASLPVYILFFTVTGASIHLSELPHVAVPAVVLLVIRAVGLLAGGYAGARVAGAPPEVQRYVGVGLLPQAGLAIAFALLFARTFPGIGEPAAALALAVISLNELIAPALFRAALVRSGEAATATQSSPGITPTAAAPVDAGTPDTIVETTGPVLESKE